jgi:glycosyltransferase involved in cell wall biosynthesis
MWSFTGGCSYSYDCRKFLSGCDEECPVAEEFPPISPDEIHSEWAEKRDLIPAGEDLYAVTPSRWLRELACSGMWPEENVTVIRNGLDIGFYRSGDNREARESLGLPLDQRLILTTKPNERRKGSLLLAPTIQSVDEDIDLVAFGAGEFDKGQTDRPIHDFGYVDEEEKVLLFNAADLYLHPAPVDNYPNTVLEALACRTPVFGFEVGGLSEMVEEGVDGYLADRLDPGRLAALVDEFLRGTLEFKEERRDRQGLRREMQAKEYIELFQRICN